jgi:hypothetical protein
MKKIDFSLEEPDRGETLTIEADKIREIVEAFNRAASERRSTKEPEYWQGRKDGLRVALAVLQPGELWDKANETSPGFRVEEKEALLRFIEDVRYNLGAALWEYIEREDKKIHPQTMINLFQWLDSYDRKAKKGEVLPAEEAISPNTAKHWSRR